MVGDREMENPPATVINDEEAVQDSESRCWDGEEVHGRNAILVVAKKSDPRPKSVRSWSASCEIAGDRPF